MLAEFSVVPVGGGESIGVEIAKVIDIVDRSGLPYRASSMGTVVEGNWEDVMGVVRKCHETVVGGGLRTFTTIVIDDRPGCMDRITAKLASVEKRLGREIKK